MSGSSDKKEKVINEDIARVRGDLKMGRFTLDFEGMDTVSVMQRAEFVRHGFWEESIKRPENEERMVSEVTDEADREDFLPYVHHICEKLQKRAGERLEKAHSAFERALKSIDARPGKKAAGIRRTIDAKCDATLSKALSDERKKIDIQKKAMARIVKIAPDSAYSHMISDILRQNEEAYAVASDLLTAQQTAIRYDTYEKRGVITEQEKKLLNLAREVEDAARLKLSDIKESGFLLMERDAVLRLKNSDLQSQAYAGLLNCAKDSLAFVAVPREVTARALEFGLWERERNYYDALKKKAVLTGFHPFKKLSLGMQIKRAEREYNEGLAFLPDAPESRLKHPPLTTLEEWEKKNSAPQEKIDDIGAEVIAEIPVELIEKETDAPRTVQLDLGEKIRAQRVSAEPAFEIEREKEVPESEKEL